MPRNRAPASSNGARLHCLARWLLDARQARHLRARLQDLARQVHAGGQVAASGVRAITVMQLSSGLLGHVILTRTLRRHKAILVGAAGGATRVIHTTRGSGPGHRRQYRFGGTRSSLPCWL